MGEEGHNKADADAWTSNPYAEAPADAELGTNSSNPIIVGSLM
ncbi:hypothetical protein Slin15195_G077550 [Septoria linicola]|uniref:Uncharacterized protein n=1 Tax=Septoria linicola TaxID=215465 RepID=A0A9Q9EK47_9PEZI|nr:hypothetical protein Slin14017_G038730 [Septoria linicola]USW54436.1 hypothetical protein Slin15195_G077550 [Septoria linicola]